MAKQIKPVSLMESGSKTAKPIYGANPRDTAAPLSASHTQTAVAPKTAVSAKSAVGQKLFGGGLIMVLLGLILIPKPELIVYRQQNIQTSSIYWPGIFGLGAGLNDSKMQVFLDDARREMRLCYTNEAEVHCSTYQITERGGVIDVGRYLLEMN